MSDGSQVCGVVYTPCVGVDPQTRINDLRIALCGECADICSILDHEMGHWYACYVTMAWQGNLCSQLLEHVRVTRGAYGECIDSRCILNCQPALDKVSGFCREYCSTCSPSNEVQQYCDQAGVYPEACRKCSMIGGSNSECAVVPEGCSYDSTNNRCVNCGMGGNFCTGNSQC